MTCNWNQKLVGLPADPAPGEFTPSSPFFTPGVKQFTKFDHPFLSHG